ncbi:MAG: ComEC family competence protein, partial [Parcubacteria group bacterium]|nr:ComEC family competence protein [Parcubacteria group bacterium]
MGVGTASFASIPFVYVYGALLAMVVLLVIFWSKRQYRLAALWGVFFILGAARLVLSQPNVSDPGHIAYYNGQDVVIQGVVSQEPDVRLDHQKLTLRARRVGQSDVKGRLLIKTELYPEYRYGDLLEVKCAIEAPEQIEDFAYDKYLARYDIYSVCWRPDIIKIASGKGNPVMAGILFAKTRFMDTINSIISEPHAAFLAGLLVGARRGIPEYLLEAFNRTGTTHIIAISGSNITIIAAVIIGFMQFLGVSRKRAFWWISAGITIF